MAAVQSEGSDSVVDIAHNETSVVGHHGTSFRGLDGNGPFGVVAASGEVGAAGVANHFASGIGEGVAVAGHADGPIVTVFFIDDGGGKDFVAARGGGGEQNARGLARRLVAHGVIARGVAVEAGGEDHKATLSELAEVVDADILARRCWRRGWCRRLGADDRSGYGDVDSVGILRYDGQLFSVGAFFEAGFQAYENLDAREMALAVNGGRVFGREVVSSHG